MTVPVAQDPSPGFVPGDHLCGFYISSRNVLDDNIGNPHYQAERLPG